MGRLLDASLIVYVVTTVHILHVHTHATMQEQRSPPRITNRQTMKQWRNVQVSLARGHQNQPLMFVCSKLRPNYKQCEVRYLITGNILFWRTYQPY